MRGRWRPLSHPTSVPPWSSYFVFAAWDVPGDAFYDAIEQAEPRVVSFSGPTVRSCLRHQRST